MRLQRAGAGAREQDRRDGRQQCGPPEQRGDTDCQDARTAHADAHGSRPGAQPATGPGRDGDRYEPKIGQCGSRLGGGGHTRTCGAIWAYVFGPIPSTSCNSSTRLNRRCSVRQAMIRSAVTGPTPGSVSSWLAVAEFRSIWPPVSPPPAVVAPPPPELRSAAPHRLGEPVVPMKTCWPSPSGWARLISPGSAEGSRPPVASIASCTREPSGSRPDPGGGPHRARGQRSGTAWRGGGEDGRPWPVGLAGRPGVPGRSRSPDGAVDRRHQATSSGLDWPGQPVSPAARQGRPAPNRAAATRRQHPGGPVRRPAAHEARPRSPRRRRRPQRRAADGAARSRLAEHVLEPLLRSAGALRFPLDVADWSRPDVKELQRSEPPRTQAVDDGAQAHRPGDNSATQVVLAAGVISPLRWFRARHARRAPRSAERAPLPACPTGKPAGQVRRFHHRIEVMDGDVHHRSPPASSAARLSSSSRASAADAVRARSYGRIWPWATVSNDFAASSSRAAARRHDPAATMQVSEAVHAEIGHRRVRPRTDERAHLNS